MSLKYEPASEPQQLVHRHITYKYILKHGPGIYDLHVHSLTLRHIRCTWSEETLL